MAAAKRTGPRNRFPWILFLILAAAIYGFWILPFQQGSQPVNVQFTPRDAK